MGQAIGHVQLDTQGRSLQECMARSQIVIGGLSDMDGDEVEKLVLARFDSPAMAMKMKIGHDKHDPKNLVVKYDGFMFAFGML